MKNNDFIIADLKNELIEIESKIRSIEQTKLKMKEWEGKPIFETCKSKIDLWENEIKNHKSNIEYYYNKFKNWEYKNK
jgi:hypothetical protein